MVSESYLAPPPDKGGRIIVESVAGWPWTGWPDARGLGGRMVVEFADSAIMLESLLPILSDIPGLAVAGYASDETAVIEQIDALPHDAAILDIGLRQENKSRALLVAAF